MKTYIKPTIDFIELKSEERLACTSNGGGSGCCSGGGGGHSGYFFFSCKQNSSPLGYLCNSIKFLNSRCRW